MRYTKMSRALLKQLYVLLNKGLSKGEIAQEAGLTYGSVHHQINRHFDLKGIKYHYNERALNILGYNKITPIEVTIVDKNLPITKLISNQTAININGITIEFELESKRNIYISNNNTITIK